MKTNNELKLEQTQLDGLTDGRTVAEYERVNKQNNWTALCETRYIPSLRKVIVLNA